MKQLFSYKVLIPLALVLAIMPPGNPHLPEKSRWLLAGTLTRPLDIFDLIWHAWPLVLLGIKIGRDLGRRLVPRAAE
jgi:hypothetical protein